MANILGTTNNDILIGTNLDDVLFGYAGDDELIGADGNDIIYGGLSNDRITGGTGNDQLIGEDGNDSIFGEDGNDALIGGTGNDALSGGNGNDYLEGDAGDDNLSGDAGNDTLYGGTGVDYLSGGSGSDLLGGEEGNDILYGNEDNDTLNGGDGDDFLDGGDGDDSLNGGRGNDNLYGGNGNDVLNGDRGIDAMAGEGGNDVYIVDNVLDTVVDEGELDGFDTVRSTVSYTLVDNVESLVLEGSSNINATGNNQANVICGNVGNNSLIGNAGGDTFIGSRGNDTINGGADSDAVTYTGLNQAVTIKPQGVIDKGAFGTDQLIGIEAISGQAGLANSIDASTNLAATTIYANLGSNQLSVNGIPSIGNLNFNVYNFVNATGGAGNDTFIGSNNNNNLIGNSGIDVFYGSGGNDTINGGSDTDYAYYTSLGQAVTLKAQGVLEKGTLGTDSLIGIENIVGQFGLANSIDASSNPASVTVNANLSSNQLSVNNIPGVGNLNFGVYYFANVTGGAGNDTITGSAYSNILTGNAGNDVFIGSNSNDTINGGIDSDTVDYSTLGQAITIKPQGVLDKGTAGIDSLIGIETIIGQAGLANSINASTNPASISINAYLSSNYLSVNGIPVIGSLAFNVQNFVNVTGGNANDSIYGNASNNIFIGGAGNDFMFGADGNDTLNGGTGIDSLYGGNGDDVFFIDDVNDFIVENGYTGNDTVYSQVSYALTISVENLNLQGTANIDGNGNTSNNLIFGNDGNNVLKGGGGQDTLYGLIGNDSLYANSTATTLVGGAGVDNFYITGRPTAGVHTIADFSVGEKVFLVGVAGATQFSNLVFTTTAADTTLSVGGQSIATFTNVAPAQLTASSFVFI